MRQGALRGGDELGTILTCNCSICSKKALLLTFIPSAQFKLLSGEDQLGDYQFNKHVIHHLFCRNCGTQSFSRGRMPDGTEMVALNVRCFDDIDISALKLTPFDGRSR